MLWLPLAVEAVTSRVGAGRSQNVEVPGQPGSEAIPAAFFGLTVKKFASVKPVVAYGTTRSWDGAGLDWAHMNPAPGIYDFSALGKFIEINQARGVQMIYTFGRTPRWASSKPDMVGAYSPGQCAPPRDIAFWDDYVRAIATYAAGRIQYWELWNEPNDRDFYCGSMTEMVKMAEDGAKIIKSVDPSARILSPGTSSKWGPVWLGKFLAGGGKAYVDIIAFHGYAGDRAANVLDLIGHYRAVMQTNGVSSKPLWDTESGWADPALSGAPPVAQQAAFVAESYLLQWSAGVSRFVWYAYDGAPKWGQLWSPDAGASAGAIAYGQIYQWMVGATMTAPCAKKQNGIWTCPLTRPGGSSAEAVWSSGGPVAINLPSTFSKIADLKGGTQAVQKHQVTVTAEPILIYSPGFIKSGSGLPAVG